ncbi:hypothetical protein FRC03_007750 [Tulasnella sp. 419]|nr:hypothetical protein FRC03_007750 [Tulasnella sp. 419]
MSGRGGPTYDQALLADAPEVGKDQRQEGYNVDLLETGRPGGSPTNTHSPIPPAQSVIGHRPYNEPKDGYNAGFNHTSYSPPKKAPFWRSTKGKILLALLAIAILGAIIGGAVGGTVGKNKSSNNDTKSPLSGNGNGNQGGGDSSGGSNEQGADPSASRAQSTTTRPQPDGPGSTTASQAGNAAGTPVTTPSTNTVGVVTGLPATATVAPAFAGDTS